MLRWEEFCWRQLSCCLLAGGACAADTRLTLHGKVVDENGLPVSNVQVKLEGLQKAIFTASTDDAGYFSISNLEPGTYSVHLEKVSFFLLRGQTIELAADCHAIFVHD